MPIFHTIVPSDYLSRFIYLGLSTCHKQQTHFGAFRQTRIDGLVVSSVSALAGVSGSMLLLAP